jgi:hypothetical protein
MADNQAKDIPTGCTPDSMMHWTSSMHWYMHINVRWPRTSHRSGAHTSMVFLLLKYMVAKPFGAIVWFLRVASSNRPWLSAASNFE